MAGSADLGYVMENRGIRVRAQLMHSVLSEIRLEPGRRFGM